MRYSLRFWLLVTLIGITSACNPLTRRPPPAMHDFGPLRDIPTIETASAPITVDAPGWLKDSRLRYRFRFDDPTRVRFYADHRWLAPPPDLLAQRLRVAVARHPYRLHLQLTDFEQIFETSDHAQVVLRFEAKAETLGSGQAVADRTFVFKRPAATPDAHGAVAAFALLVDEAVDAVQTWLASLAGPKP